MPKLLRKVLGNATRVTVAPCLPPPLLLNCYLLHLQSKWFLSFCLVVHYWVYSRRLSSFSLVFLTWMVGAGQAGLSWNSLSWWWSKFRNSLVHGVAVHSVGSTSAYSEYITVFFFSWMSTGNVNSTFSGMFTRLVEYSPCIRYVHGLQLSEQD